MAFKTSYFNNKKVFIFYPSERRDIIKLPPKIKILTYANVNGKRNMLEYINFSAMRRNAQKIDYCGFESSYYHGSGVKALHFHFFAELPVLREKYLLDEWFNCYWWLVVTALYAST